MDKKTFLACVIAATGVNIVIFYFLRSSVYNNSSQALRTCSNITQGQGSSSSHRIAINVTEPTWDYLNKQNTVVEPGGRYKPTDCDGPDRVAIIIPYRDRETHLKIFFQNMHPLLQRQKLEYGIYVIEMARHITFNRALLMNVGFVEAAKLKDYQCYVFHDVDLLPEDDRIRYTCPHTPRHLSSAYNIFNYTMPYSSFFGGVTALTKEHFIKINGFSNQYFGWGAEDDDLRIRVEKNKLVIDRYETDIGRYRMLIHGQSAINPRKSELLSKAFNNADIDGLNSLHYTILKSEVKRLYTWMLVSVSKEDVSNGIYTHINTTAFV